MHAYVFWVGMDTLSSRSPISMQYPSTHRLYSVASSSLSICRAYIMVVNVCVITALLSISSLSTWTTSERCHPLSPPHHRRIARFCGTFVGVARGLFARSDIARRAAWHTTWQNRRTTKWKKKRQKNVLGISKLCAPERINRLAAGQTAGARGMAR